MTSQLSCPFCASNGTRIRYAGEYHKIDRTFGPFDLFECLDCGSSGTTNPPSQERLAAFYSEYHKHRPGWYTKAGQLSALSAQYEFYAQFIVRMSGQGTCSWIDIGAGHGEIATLMMSHLPGSKGLAVDITGRPERLDSGVEYRPLDINAPNWVGTIGRKFDLVYSVAVWEHVVDPSAFAREALSLVADGGLLILICPDYGSLARRFLGRFWPFFQPGEHLSLPSVRGARASMLRSAQALKIDSRHVEISAGPLWIGYSVKYALLVLRLNALAQLVPAGVRCPLPAGALHATVRLRSGVAGNDPESDQNESSP